MALAREPSAAAHFGLRDFLPTRPPKLGQERSGGRAASRGPPERALLDRLSVGEHLLNHMSRCCTCSAHFAAARS